MTQALRLRVLLATTLAVALAFASACGTHTPPTIPNLQTVVIKTDAEFRAALANTYGFLKIAGETVDAALDAEQTLAAKGAVPADLDAGFKQAVRAFALEDVAVVKAIDTHALTSWAQVQAKVNPVLEKVNAVLAIAQQSGPSVWSKILNGLIAIAMVLLQPGAMYGGGL